MTYQKSGKKVFFKEENLRGHGLKIWEWDAAYPHIKLIPPSDGIARSMNSMKTYEKLVLSEVDQ